MKLGKARQNYQRSIRLKLWFDLLKFNICNYGIYYITCLFKSILDCIGRYRIKVIIKIIVYLGVENVDWKTEKLFLLKPNNFCYIC